MQDSFLEGRILAQYLKATVRARIGRAALAEFARVGVRRATMAGIARRARISTGNVYHYYPTKSALFGAVLPDAFVRRLEALIRRRVRALDGIDDVRSLGPEAPFTVVAEDLLAFALEHRLEVIVLLGHSAGTRHERFADTLAGTMQRLAIRHFRALQPGLRVTRSHRVVLDRIYRSWVETTVDILRTQTTDAAVRSALEAFSRYHLSGLRALFESTVP